MLHHFDAVKNLAEHPAELELAIWFHDAIYKVFSKTNEFDSAVWAKEFALSNGYGHEGAERIFNLVMATQHNEEVQSSDQKLIVDIDLSILGVLLLKHMTSSRRMCARNTNGCQCSSIEERESTAIISKRTKHLSLAIFQG